MNETITSKTDFLGEKKILRAWLLVVFIIITGIIISAMLSLWKISSPQLFRTATSPDGSWTVEIWRQAVFGYPYNQEVNVFMVVKNADGQVVKRENIEIVDLWEDVETRISECQITNTEIRIRYTYGDYIVTKADLML